MSKLLVAEAALLVFCSVIAVPLVASVVWFLRRGALRGRRRRTWRLAALRRWFTPRRLAVAGGGLFLLAITGWWVVDWLHVESPSTSGYAEVVDTAADLDGVEWVEVDGAADPAARQKLVSERWRRGLPLLGAIGLLVAGWVALAHLGVLDPQQHRRVATARVKDRR